MVSDSNAAGGQDQEPAENHDSSLGYLFRYDTGHGFMKSVIPARSLEEAWRKAEVFFETDRRFIEYYGWHQIERDPKPLWQEMRDTYWNPGDDKLPAYATDRDWARVIEVVADRILHHVHVGGDSIDEVVDRFRLEAAQCRQDYDDRLERNKGKGLGGLRQSNQVNRASGTSAAEAGRARP